jgi:hypothetical protein
VWSVAHYLIIIFYYSLNGHRISNNVLSLISHISSMFLVSLFFFSFLFYLVWLGVYQINISFERNNFCFVDFSYCFLFPTYWFVLYFLAFLYFCRVSICLTIGSLGGWVWVGLGTPWVPKFLGFWQEGWGLGLIWTSKKPRNLWVGSWALERLPKPHNGENTVSPRNVPGEIGYLHAENWN